MTDANDQPNDAELAETVAMLEQILEVMPQDMMTLKALYNAYVQHDMRKKAFDYLCRIADVASSEMDQEAVAFAAEQFESFREEFPDVVAGRLAQLCPSSSSGGSSVSSDTDGGAQEDGVDISEELSFAWRLYEDDQLSQDDYSGVLHDLTETSSKDLDVPVSVFHVLSDRAYANINRIISYCAVKSGTPCISLSDFDIDEGMAKVFPLEVCARDGVMPFGYIGKDLMVAVLNPFNSSLIARVEQLTGLRCHPYLVMPEEYDAKLKWIRDILSKG